MDEQIAELAGVIAGQCEALANGKTPAGTLAAAIRIHENAATLLAWAKLGEQS